jgi:hypothetical protein
MTVKGFYNKGYVYNERAPYFIERTIQTDTIWQLLQKVKLFV